MRNPFFEPERPHVILCLKNIRAYEETAQEFGHVHGIEERQALFITRVRSYARGYYTSYRSTSHSVAVAHPPCLAGDCWFRSLCGAVTKILRYVSLNTLESSNSFRSCQVCCRDAPIKFAKACWVIPIQIGRAHV